MDLVDTSQALQHGKFTASALLEQHLDRIERDEPHLNCFITLDEVGARNAASAADSRYRSGHALSPLDGIPVAFKDNMDVAGLPITNGTAGFQMATTDAEVVNKLRAAGAVILGKLNMDECALGAVTNNAHHGATSNPWRAGYTPGGSSGGAAAAVAAGFVLVALGSDTLGSIRLPSAYCGVTGLKATKGLISNQGVTPLSSLLDHVGPICRSVRDLSFLLGFLAGEDASNPNSITPPEAWASDLQSRTNLKDLRIGYLVGPEIDNLDEDVASGFDDVQKELLQMGATLVPISSPQKGLRKLRREAFLIAEAEAGETMSTLLDTSPDSFSSDVKSMLEFGRNVSLQRLEQAKAILTEAENLITQWFEGADRVDLIVSPTAPQIAFPHKSSVPENQADFTALANISGCPAIALPTGIGPSGLPFSVQLMAPAYTESMLLGVAAVLEKRFGCLSTPDIKSIASPLAENIWFLG